MAKDCLTLVRMRFCTAAVSCHKSSPKSPKYFDVSVWCHMHFARLLYWMNHSSTVSSNFVRGSSIKLALKRASFCCFTAFNMFLEDSVAQWSDDFSTVFLTMHCCDHKCRRKLVSCTTKYTSTSNSRGMCVRSGFHSGPRLRLTTVNQRTTNRSIRMEHKNMSVQITSNGFGCIRLQRDYVLVARCFLFHESCFSNLSLFQFRVKPCGAAEIRRDCLDAVLENWCAVDEVFMEHVTNKFTIRTKRPYLTRSFMRAVRNRNRT